MGCYIILAMTALNEETISIDTADNGHTPAVEPAQRASDAIDIAIDVLEELQKAVAAGPPKRLRIRFGDKVVAEFPLAVTAAAALAAGLAAALITKLAIELTHES